MSRRPKKHKKKDFFDAINKEALQLRSPACKHFPACGGCRFQDVACESQIALKEAYLQDLFKKKVVVTMAPSGLGYRNRMDFVYAFGKLGLRKRGNFREVVAIDECLLLPSFPRKVFSHVKEVLQEHNIASYDFLEHSGFLRYVTFRFAPSSKELMVIFTSTTPTAMQEESLRKVFSQLQAEAVSIYWFVNDSITDVSVPFTKPYFVLGKKTITEQLNDISLAIAPQSFFQANSKMVTIIFEKIKEFVHGNTVDLCSGVGAITLFVADKATSVIGVEEVEQAVLLARENAKINKKKALFFTAPMKKFTDVAPLEVNTIIVDPPRSGLGRKVAEKIIASTPETIIYMSCNPKTQKIDMEFFQENYREVFLQGYDMFPQTSHVETLLVLQKK